jgi:hypothetical protein
MAAGQRAIAAAERRPSSPKVGKDDFIKNPREHFGKVFGGSSNDSARACST